MAAAWTSLSWLVELQDLDLLSDTPYQSSFLSDKNMKRKKLISIKAMDIIHYNHGSVR